jgi:hypothetical protein
MKSLKIACIVVTVFTWLTAGCSGGLLRERYELCGSRDGGKFLDDVTLSVSKRTL